MTEDEFFNKLASIQGWELRKTYSDINPSGPAVRRNVTTQFIRESDGWTWDCRLL